MTDVVVPLFDDDAWRRPDELPVDGAAWRADAEAKLRDVIDAGGVGFKFTTDAVPTATAEETRGLGPIMTAAERAGFIRKVEPAEWWNSTDPRCHGRPKQVWVVTRTTREAHEASLR